MKRSEVRELLKKARGLSLPELEKLIREKKRELMDLRFQAAIGQLSQNHRIQDTKKTIARLLTVWSEKRKGGEDA